MSWLYLLSIVVSACCMGLVDHRWRLFLFGHGARAVVLVVLGIAFFLTWDVVAIALGVYQRGESPAMTGIELLPELPLEEVLFVTFFCYITMVLHRLFALLSSRVAAQDHHGAGR